MIKQVGQKEGTVTVKFVNDSFSFHVAEQDYGK
jgi:hypothetical protein